MTLDTATMVQLGSALVHAAEHFAHLEDPQAMGAWPYDKAAFDQCYNDPSVRAVLKHLDELCLLPVRRDGVKP